MTAHARRTDPVTSAEAAGSVKALTRTKTRILRLLHGGPMTRDDLIETWRAVYMSDLTTDQSIRSRLAELMRSGHVIVTGHTTNQRGRTVQIIGLPPRLDSPEPVN